MPIEYAAIATLGSAWYDGWAFQHQLWTTEGIPGGELDLVPTGRNLTARWRDGAGNLVLSGSELSSRSPISLIHKERGVVEICLTGDHWQAIKEDQIYTCEILAYGAIKKSFPFNTKRPQPSETIVNGVEIYGSPSGVLNTIGQIPGADTETTVDLSSGWSLNPQGYWVKALIPGQKIYGLWVNGRHVRSVPYNELATAGDRASSRVGDTLYYKGSEQLDAFLPFGVETAFSPYVLRCLQIATAEIDHRTGRGFNQRRIIREPHRTLHRQDQAFPRHNPVQNDRWFRLDNYSQGRSLSRRYTQADIDNGSIHLESSTGMITLTSRAWDYGDFAFAGMSGWGDKLFSGENNTEITYTGGFPITPIDVDDAANSLAAIRQGQYWQTAMSQGMDAISIGCVNLNFGEMISRWFPQWKESADMTIASYQSFDIDHF